MRKLFLTIYSFLLVFLFLTIFFHPTTSLSDDLGRHLLLGNLILQTHSVPQINLLSYTYPKFPFINTSWLPEIFFSMLIHIGGFNLLLIAAMLLALSAYLIQVVSALRSNSLVSVLIASTLYILLLSLRSDIRPELFSMFFLSIFIAILYRTYQKQNRLIFLLIPLEAIWVNMHIYFFAGPLLISLFLIDNLWTNKCLVKKTTKIYFFTLLGTLAATLTNPNGIKGAIYPFVVLQNYGLQVTENQSIFSLYHIYQQTNILFPFFVISLLFTLLFLCRRNTKLIDWMLTIVFGLATIIIFRNILLFVFTTFLLFVSQLDYVGKKYLIKLKRFLPSYFFVLLGIGSLFILTIVAIQSFTIHSLGFGLIDYGKGAGDFIIQNKLKGPYFNDFNIGGYLSYRIYPQRVFIDNRPEAYPARFLQDIYTPLQRTPSLFEKEDKTYRFNTLVLSHWDGTPYKNGLLRYLLQNPSYTVVYLDTYAIIFQKKTGNTLFVSTHHIRRTTIPISTIHDPQEIIHYLFFYEKVGWCT